MDPTENAERKNLKKDRDEALRAISNAAIPLSPARQRELNTWLRELVARIEHLRVEDSRPPARRPTR
jgi:hypothetical protein